MSKHLDGNSKENRVYRTEKWRKSSRNEERDKKDLRESDIEVDKGNPTYV